MYRCLIAGLLLLPGVLFGQDFASKVKLAEKWMAEGQYARAKYQLTLAIGDETPGSMAAIQASDSNLVERAENDLLETQIRTGEWAAALLTLQQQISFQSPDEGIRRFHLDCLLGRQKAMLSYFGADNTVFRLVNQAEKACALLKQNASYIKDYDALALMLQEDLLLAYYTAGRMDEVAKVLILMQDKSEKVPFGRKGWPVYYWFFKTLISMGKEPISNTEKKFKEVLVYFLQHEPEQSYLPFSVLADMYRERRDFASLRALVKKTSSALQERTLMMLRSMIEKDRYAVGRDYNTLRFYHLLNDLPEGCYEDVLFDAALFSKNVLLDLYRETAGNVYALQDEDLLEEYRRLQFHSGDVSSWYENILFLERYEVMNPPLSPMKYSWREVEVQLQAHDVAIEFIRTGAGFKDYSALIVRKGWTMPKQIRLCTEDDLSLFNAEAGSHRGDAAREAFRKIFSPLQAYIAPGEHVFYSPDGKIAQLNLDAFIDECGRLAGDIYHLHRVRTTRSLPSVKASSPFDHLNLFGGMDYDASFQDILDETLLIHKVVPLVVLEKRDQVPGDLYFGLTQEGERAGYTPLPYSLDELKIIYEAWDRSETRFCASGVRAVEEWFKYRVYRSSPQDKDIYHFATHSFKAPETEAIYGLSREEEAFKKEGLLFSGASHAINKEALPAGMNDQLLYSEEIGRMDLRSADLVVLSACNTARGEDSLDGILGLQRAFKRAGAGTIVMTLWSVDDLATMVFMGIFYRFLFSGNSKYEAFRLAQSGVRELYDDPYYWAPFIMLD